MADFAIEMTFRRHLGGTLHVWKLEGIAQQKVVWPEEMVQGGESYRIGIDDLPADLIDHITESMGYDLQEG